MVSGVLRKTAKWLGFGFLAALIIVIIAVVLAVQTPEFYQQRRQLAGNQASVTEDLQQQFSELESWAAGASEQDEQTRSIIIPEAALNAWMNHDASSMSDLQHPRVELSEDQIRLGVEVGREKAWGIFSICVSPVIAADNRLHLELTSARVGSLPVPLNTVLRRLSPQLEQSGQRTQLDVSGPSPIIVVRLPDRKRTTPQLKTVECRDGQLELEFVAGGPN